MDHAARRASGRRVRRRAPRYRLVRKADERAYITFGGGRIELDRRRARKFRRRPDHRLGASIDLDEDVYGRKLRIVMVNGISVGDTLVSEGLARYLRGREKAPWC